MPRTRFGAALVAAAEAVAGGVLGLPFLLGGAVLTALFGLLAIAIGRMANRPDRLADRVFAIGVVALAMGTAVTLPHSEAAAALLPILGIVPLLPASSRRQELTLLGAALAAGVVVLGLGAAPQLLPPLPAPMDVAVGSGGLIGVAYLIALALGDLSGSVRESLGATALALRRQEAIFDGAIEPMLLADDALVLVDANAAAAALLGVPRDELVGRGMAEFWEAAGDRASIWRRFVARGADRQRIAVRRPDGRELLVEAASTANIVPGQHLTVWHDVTRQVRDDQERRAVLAALGRLNPRGSVDATARVVVHELCRLPGIDVAAVIGVDGVSFRTIAISSAVPFPMTEGDLLPESRIDYLVGKLARGAWGELWLQREEDGAYGEAFEASGIRGQAYAPIVIEETVVGLIAIATVDELYSHHLVEDVPAVAEFAVAASASLGPQLLERNRVAAVRQGLSETIAQGRFQAVFQPVVDLATGEVVGYEALTRFADGRRPDLVFADAARAGLSSELQRVTIERAICEAVALPKGAWLSLNATPSVLAAGDGFGGACGTGDRPLVIEISEQERIDDYAAIWAAVADLGPDVQLAVDDAGAGEANLAHIVDLRAQFVKLDIRLVRGIDTDVVRQALIVGLQHFAERSGCTLIAEGVETDAELATLHELGVMLGQGFLLGRPMPASDWAA